MPNTPPRANQLDVLEQIAANTKTAGGSATDSAATSDTGTFSITALIKRGLQNWTTLLSRIPSLVNGATPIVATTRVCVGTARITVTTVSNGLTALIGAPIPAGAVTCEIQPDGGSIRMRRDGVAVTTTLGVRIDDGVEKLIDTPLNNVRLIAGGTVNVPANVIFFDRV